MTEMFLEALRFLIILVTVLAVPGFVFVSLYDRQGRLDALERLVLAVVVSLSMATFTGIFFDLFGIPIVTATVAGVYALWLIALVFLIRLYHVKQKAVSAPKRRLPILFVWIFALMVCVKAIFLMQYTVPISTDLGHHMYWAQSIVETGELPMYEEREILMVESNEERHRISDSRPISDVIIGEHVIFAFLALLSGTSLISIYPILVLFFIHIITLLGVYVLARRLFLGHALRERVALLALMFSGILFGLDSPQMKYIVGGVVGNTFGNVFIVSIVLMLFLGIRYRSRNFLALGVALCVALAYTHHLSTLLLAFSLVGMIVALALIRWKFFLGEFLHIAFSRHVLATVAIGAVFFFFVWTPAYIANSAVENVVGEAKVEKAEHAGISLADYVFALGDVRMLLAFVGLALVVGMGVWFRRSVGKSGERKETPALRVVVLLGWLWPLFILIFTPSVVGVDIPTIRTANYTILPMAIVGGFALVWILSEIARQRGLGRVTLSGVLVVLIVGFVAGGWRDNAQLLKQNNEGDARELHRVASYLGEHYRDLDATVMYDHIHIDGGSWMKLYFMEDYNYPFYRALLFRYDRATDKSERCTLDVFTYPDTDEARKCFENLNISALAMNEVETGKAFREDSRFTRVYAGENISVYTENR